jgi:hypothetical protein
MFWETFGNEFSDHTKFRQMRHTWYANESISLKHVVDLGGALL